MAEPMNAVKIPLGMRILAYNARDGLPPWPWFLLRHRWAGQLPEDGVLTERGLAGGACGHYSFWKRTMLRHQHPGDRPVPADMQAALRGEAPVPEWFLQGRPQGQSGTEGSAGQ